MEEDEGTDIDTDIVRDPMKERNTRKGDGAQEDRVMTRNTHLLDIDDIDRGVVMMKTRTKRSIDIDDTATVTVTLHIGGDVTAAVLRPLDTRAGDVQDQRHFQSLTTILQKTDHESHDLQHPQMTEKPSSVANSKLDIKQKMMLTRRHLMTAPALVAVAAVAVPLQVQNQNVVEYHPNQAHLPPAQPALQSAPPDPDPAPHHPLPAPTPTHHNCPPKWTNTSKNPTTRA